MSSVKDVLFEQSTHHRQIAIKEHYLVQMIQEEGFRIENICFGQMDGDGDKVALIDLYKDLK